MEHGILLNHSKARDPHANGKFERFHGTLKSIMRVTQDKTNPKSLQVLVEEACLQYKLDYNLTRI